MISPAVVVSAFQSDLGLPRAFDFLAVECACVEDHVVRRILVVVIVFPLVLLLLRDFVRGPLGLGRRLSVLEDAGTAHFLSSVGVLELLPQLCVEVARTHVIVVVVEEGLGPARPRPEVAPVNASLIHAVLLVVV